MPNLNALLGSRICHDLINPLGAIGNGVELLGLAGVPESPEMTLISESVDNAAAKLKFMRLAFGDATADQIVGRAEIVNILETMTQGARLTYSWNVQGDVSRLDVRVALLSAMCIETALPMGGNIDTSQNAGHWSIYAKHERLNLDPALWAPLSKGACPDSLSANQVHFGLLPPMAIEAGRTLTMTHGADWVQISF